MDDKSENRIIGSIGNPYQRVSLVQSELNFRQNQQLRASSNGRRRLRTTDFEEFESFYSAWDAVFRQMSCGPFEGSIADVRIGQMRVLHETANQSLQIRAAMTAPGYLFTPVAGPMQQAIWRGRSLTAGKVNLVGPNTQIDHLSASDAEYFSIFVNRDLLEESAAVRFGVDLPDYLKSCISITPRHGQFQSTIDTLKTIVMNEPQLDNNGEAELEDELIGLLLGGVVAADEKLEDLSPLHRRTRIARRAEEYMLAHLEKSPTMLELCRELDVSERGLQYAFRERFGISPKRYLKTQRLNLVRRELKSAGADWTTVRALAKKLGFTHPGEFAADYLRQFGELPSATRRRSDSHKSES